MANAEKNVLLFFLAVVLLPQRLGGKCECYFAGSMGDFPARKALKSWALLDAFEFYEDKAMSETYSADGPDLNEPLPPEILSLLEKGKSELVMVLPGTERPNKGVDLYAQTFVEIDFKDEDNLQRCVKLLHWSDQRLSRLPALLAMWDWQKTERLGMKILFSTGWYDKDFFEERNTAFLGRDHASYFSKFGARPEDLKVRHEVYGS